MEEQDYIDIEAWLQGELPPDRQAEFKRRAAEDADFAAAFEDRRELNEHLRATVGEAAFRATITAAMRADRTEAKVVNMQSKRKRRVWMSVLAAAASVLLLIVAFQFLFDGDSFDYNDFNDHSPLALVERGAANDAAQRAEQAFNTGDYATAIPELLEYLELPDSNPQAKLALGISYLETGKQELAEAIFREIATAQDDFSAYGNWYLALLSVRQGKNKAALTYLDLIPADNAYLAAKAKQLRESL